MLALSAPICAGFDTPHAPRTAERQGSTNQARNPPARTESSASASQGVAVSARYAYSVSESPAT